MSTPVLRLGWEDLRKEARKLESEIDQKLASYSKLGSAYTLGNHSDTLDGSEAEQRAVEIDILLQQLASLNESMAECASSNGTDLHTHTLARHNDILQEFSEEFKRVKTVVTNSVQHAILVGSLNKNRDTIGSSQANISANQALLRERSSVLSATSRADEVILQAQTTISALSDQKSLFTDTFSKLNSMATKFPLVNGILGAIRRKKSRDTIILSSVIGLCTLFLIIYWLNK